LEENKALLQVVELKKYFHDSSFNFRGSRTDKTVKAVDGVDLNISEGEIVGLVGESGCGKSTLGKLILKLLTPTSGKILFNGLDTSKFKRNETREFRKMVQTISQDPFDSLDPRRTIIDSVCESAYANHLLKSKREAIDLCKSLLDSVRLQPSDQYLYHHPDQLSGGQRQRVAIARALSVNPKLIVADEISSMLDVSVRGDLLNLLLSMREKYSISILFITHDLPSAAQICDRLAVMYLGKIVEIGPCEKVIQDPSHPYTRALIAAIPVIGSSFQKLPLVPGSGFTRATDLPNGCRFHPRCVYQFDRCKIEEPKLLPVSMEKKCACFLYGD